MEVTSVGMKEVNFLNSSSEVSRYKWWSGSPTWGKLTKRARPEAEDLSELLVMMVP